MLVRVASNAGENTLKRPGVGKEVPRVVNDQATRKLPTHARYGDVEGEEDEVEEEDSSGMADDRATRRLPRYSRLQDVDNMEGWDKEKVTAYLESTRKGKGLRAGRKAWNYPRSTMPACYQLVI